MRSLVLLLISCLWLLPALAQRDGLDKVDKDLSADLAAGNAADFLVVLRAQADLSVVPDMLSKEEKGQMVYRQLRQVAEKTQPPLWAILEEAGVEYHSFFLVNAIQVRQGKRQLVEQLALNELVREIQPDKWVRLDEGHPQEIELQLRSEVTWGLEKINAPVVWDLGFKGQGIVIAGQDSGYEWDHPAIRDSYRGWEGNRVDHNYNWHDAIHEISPLNNDPTPDPARNPCGLNSRTPCDDHSHGTHTMGTMTGNNEAGTQIGVAPAARWMGCRNMERGWGRPSSYLECFEWFLAPTDLDNNGPDTRLAPHVINNSWGCPDIEGCNPSNWALMEQAVETLRAAGIVVVVSAGNSGLRGCGSVSDAPAIFEGSFSVGASTVNDAVANFSSRGPVSVDGSRRLKPNVVAPGTGVRSAVRNGGYASWNGTSMAGPHVAGAVAVLLSANPHLAGHVDLIESILEQTAVPLSTNVSCEDYSGQKQPNPIYGYGRIDLLAAVKKASQIYIAPDFPIDRLKPQIFPNPAATEAVFRFLEWPGALDLRLTDAMGREVKHEVWPELNGLEKAIYLEGLPPGVYFFHLVNKEHHWSGTLIKK